LCGSWLPADRGAGAPDSEMASAPLIHLKIDNLRNALVDLIETILVYKFPNRTKEEIIAMLGTDDLKKTRFYKDVFAEGQEEGREQGQEEGREQGREEIQQKGVVELLKLGLAAEQIARSLSLPLATTKKMIQAAKRKS
jgi:predicted transposase/invertase (TIGR01784 family)